MPRVFTFEAEQEVGRPLPEVFRFFSRPENLALITPPGMGFNILTPSPVPMKAGTLIDYTIRIAGFPVHWRTMITDYQPEKLFVDEQLIGPYMMWHHTHSFSESSGGTLVRDRVVYALPLGIFGELAHTMVVRRQIESIFRHRRAAIEHRFSSIGKEGTTHE